MNKYKLPEEFEKQLVLLRQEVLSNPKDSQLLVALGSFLYAYSNNLDEATYYLKEAIENDHTNVNAYFWLAFCLHYDYCEYEQAAELVKKALKLEPRRPDCLSLMAYIISALGGLPDERLFYIKSAIDSAPDWPLIRFELINILIEKKEFNLVRQEISVTSNILTSLAKNFVEPLDPVSQYYERSVTGRSSPFKEELFYKIVEKFTQIK